MYTLPVNNTRLSLIFKRLGFRKHSADIYLYLLKNGPTLATNIVSNVEAYRPAVYRSLFELHKAKLLVKQKNGKRFLWNAVDPKRIEDMFTGEVRATEKSLPKSLRSTEVVNDSIRILKGKDGIRAAFDDAINHMDKGGTFYRYTSEKDLDAVNAYLSKDYRARRDSKHLERKVISNPISGKKKSKRLERFIKFIPDTTALFTQNIIQLIYKDRVALIDLNKEEVLIIENKALADFQTTIFKQLYGKL